MNEFGRIGFNYGSFYYAYILRWQLLGQSITGNYSNIRLQASVYVGANYIDWTWGNGSLHGFSFNLSSRYGKGESIVCTRDITVNHDANGNASIYVSGSINSSFLMNGSCGGTINLPKIDRTAPAVSLAISEIKENSISFRYSVNLVCDIIQAKLNNGNWFSLNSSPTVLNDLSEETVYTLQIRAKRQNNQVWGYSSALSFKTLAGTFAWISKNGSSFKGVEVYLVTSLSTIKLSKKSYKTLKGDKAK